MLISDQYRTVLTREHASSNWGITGLRYAPKVNSIMLAQGFNTLLDYGCGQGLLAEWFNQQQSTIQLQEYEPGRPHLAHMPKPAELVACVDVMEHVEPECVIAVLDHIQQLSQRMVYFNISLRPACRILNDGRNAHLTVCSQQWWLDLLCARWSQVEINPGPDSFDWLGSR